MSLSEVYYSLVQYCLLELLSVLPVVCLNLAVHNTQHKCELRMEVKGTRQRTGELNIIFGGIEVNLADAARANGEPGRGKN